MGRNLDHFKAVMRTELHTTTALNADKGFTGRIQVDGIHRASLGTGSATNAQLLIDHHTTPISL
jgi:hypothetical protein